VNHLRKRLTYANVMSSVAVFLALGGAAFAAAQLPKNSVGTKQLKKNAVNSAKIKDSSLKAIDFQAGQLPAGPQGPKGDAGPKGDTGPRGPSAGFTAQGESNFEIGQSSSAPALVSSLNLPAGKYLVIGETGLTNISGGSRDAWCELKAGGNQLGVTRALDIASQRSGDSTVLGGVSLSSGGTVEFVCWSESTGVYVPAESNPAMQAIEVASLNGA